MTIFGTVWLMLLFAAIIKNKKKMLVTLVLFSSIFQSSNVVSFGGQGIGPQVITSGIVSVYFLLPKIKKLKLHVSKSIFTPQKMLIILLLYIIFNSIYAGTLGVKLLGVAQLAVYILCFAAMESAGQYLDDEYTYYTLRKMSVFVLVVGVVQVLATTNIIPRYWFIRDIFWNDGVNNPDVVQFMWPGSYFRFFSTYMEPSYFVGFSLGAMFYFINHRKKRKDNILLIGALGIATLLSFSSAGYGALLLTIIIYMALSKDGKMKFTILIGGLIGFSILYFGFYNILDSVIFSKMSSGSAAARMGWDRVAIEMFQSSPIFGNGYKSCRASSLYYTILAELGIVGFVLYIIFIFSIVLPTLTKKRQKKAGDDQVCIIFAIIAVVATQMIAVPDFDICTFWMWMNFLALIYGRNNRRRRENEIAKE